MLRVDLVRVLNPRNIEKEVTVLGSNWIRIEEKRKLFLG
jgi:hypothetical protein